MCEAVSGTSPEALLRPGPAPDPSDTRFYLWLQRSRPPCITPSLQNLLCSAQSWPKARRTLLRSSVRNRLSFSINDIKKGKKNRVPLVIMEAESWLHFQMPSCWVRIQHSAALLAPSPPSQAQMQWPRWGSKEQDGSALFCKRLKGVMNGEWRKFKQCRISSQWNLRLQCINN